MNEGSLSDEELENMIQEINQAHDLSLSAEDEQKRAKVQATLLLHIYRATNSLADSSRKLEKLTWGLAILTIILVLKELGII